MSTQILQNGNWSKQILTGKADEGYLDVSLNVRGGIQASLEVQGVIGGVKQLGNTGNRIAIPLESVGDEPVAIVAVAEGNGNPFPGNESVALSIKVGGAADSFLLSEIPVGGQLRAALLILSKDVAKTIRMAPPKERVESKGLGGWMANRLDEIGELLPISVTEFMVDTSLSMGSKTEQVEQVKGFLASFCEAAGQQMPNWFDLTTGGISSTQVGAVITAPQVKGVRAVLVSDLPVVVLGLETLSVGSAATHEYFSRDHIGDFVIPDAVWQILSQSDANYDRSTFDAIRPLMTWLTKTSVRKD